ncbi:hypothetical protein JTE90_008429 [Oedothorax gibbosus]|uniref:Uncharacterized protein n=1 Tax=Oedothorax gibbosus TaxID=931172 RepID=A0AAV6UT86_9ARAC|nr:hypothetical protein JTE90_008429 [Oedothorax gibbosus]
MSYVEKIPYSFSVNTEHTKHTGSFLLVHFQTGHRPSMVVTSDQKADDPLRVQTGSHYHGRRLALLSNRIQRRSIPNQPLRVKILRKGTLLGPVPRYA